MVDPIADLLNRIKNAQAVNLSTVEVPFSKLKFEIVKILEREGFVEKAEKKRKKIKKGESKPKPFIEILLKYEDKTPAKSARSDSETRREVRPKGRPAISGLKKISKPGQRIYLPWKKIKRVKGGYGIAIISTSKGLMTDKEARKQKIGGEVICEIW